MSRNVCHKPRYGNTLCGTIATTFPQRLALAPPEMVALTLSHLMWNAPAVKAC